MAVSLAAAALIGGALSAGSGVLGTALNYKSAKEATNTNAVINYENNRFNAQQAELNRTFSATEAQKVRDFEERLSNTQYQRAFEDAKAAGINPTAALLGTSGGSTPSASSAQGFAAQASGFAGARAADASTLVRGFEALSYMVGSAAKLSQYKDLVGSENVYDFTKALTNSKTAKAVSDLAKSSDGESWNDLMNDLAKIPSK